MVLAVIYAVLLSNNRKLEEQEKAREESEIIRVTDLGQLASFSYESPQQEALHFETTGSAPMTKKSSWNKRIQTELPTLFPV